MKQIKVKKVDISDRIKNDPDEPMWVITALSGMSNKRTRMSGGMTKKEAEKLKKEIDSSKELSKLWTKVRVENLEFLGKDVAKSFDSAQLNDAKEIIKTKEHEVKVYVEDDPKAAVVDVYVDGQRIVEFNADHTTGKVSYITMNKNIKKRQRDTAGNLK